MFRAQSAHFKRIYCHVSVEAQCSYLRDLFLCRLSLIKIWWLSRISSILPRRLRSHQHAQQQVKQKRVLGLLQASR